MGHGVILIFNFIYQHSSQSELGNIFVSLGRAIMKRTLIAGFSQIILIISLACFSCETQKMPASLLSLFFFRVCVPAAIMVPGVPSVRGNWVWESRHVTAPCFISWRKLRSDWCESSRAFPERVWARILSLESVDHFGTSESFDGGAMNWLGVVNSHFLQMSLLMSMRFIFGDDWNDAPSSSRFWSLAMM